MKKEVAINVTVWHGMLPIMSMIMLIIRLLKTTTIQMAGINLIQMTQIFPKITSAS